MNRKKLLNLMPLLLTIICHFADASSLTLKTSTLPGNKRDVIITKSEVISGGKTIRFSLKFRGTTIETSGDIACNQDLTPYSPYQFNSPIDQYGSCKVLVSNISQLHCPEGPFEVEIDVRGSNCDQYIDLLLNSEINLYGSVTQENSIDDLVNVNLILK